jgi:acetyl esterase/lipase
MHERTLMDWTQRRTVLDLGRSARVSRRRHQIELPGGRLVGADIYRPADLAEGELLPTVVFVHGDASPADLEGVLGWGQYRAWGEAVASVGLGGFVFQHRSSDGLQAAREVLAEVSDVLSFVQHDAAPLGIDGRRIGLWTCSAGSPFGVIAGVRAVPPVACLVSLYGLLDLRHIADQLPATVSLAGLAALSPAAIVPHLASFPPTLLVKAALDRAEINASMDAYVAALPGSAEIELLVHPTGHHAFDLVDDDPTSAALIRRVIEFLRRHLT